jgi:GT2 family glycosyltransferase
MLPSPLPKISVVIPIYGNVGDLDRLIAALNGQTLKPYEIIVVDSSPKPLAQPPKGDNVKYVKNPVDVALSWDYNLGLKENTGDFQLNMQQDCRPEDPTALERLYNHLVSKPGRVAAVALVTLPRENFEKYNFWGQVLMARWVGRLHQGISGKFDLIRKDVFLKIGGYNTTYFRFAGEDMDLFMRLSENGEVYVAPDVEIVHYHHQSLKTGWVHLFKKHYQVAESFGALFRHWGFKLWKIPYTTHWSHHLAKYFYLGFLALPFWPLWTTVALIILSQLTNLESWKLGGFGSKCLLFLVNPLLFLAGFAGTVLGLVTGHQRYSQNK